MFALGLALQRKGHQVVIAGPPDFVGDAIRLNLDYHAMGGNITAFLASNSYAVVGNVVRMARTVKRTIGAEVAAQFEVLGGLATRADRVVGASLAFAARSCAERADRPFRFIAFAPETFPSRHHPALGIRRQHLPCSFNRVSWWLARRLDNWLLRAAINQGRAELGLPAIVDALDHFASPACSLLATDAELAPAPVDVPLRAAPTGAMLLDEPGQLPDKVEAFLVAGPPPIYVGFGSMPDVRGEETRQMLLKAVRAAGCRALVYTSDPTMVGQHLAPDVLTVGTLPHGLLFPRAALAVHHGGAGTSARAARAGIPQVILPHALDQFPWSARIAERGLGPKPILKHRPTARILADRIRKALGDAGVRGRAVSLARKLAGRDGAAQVAEILIAD